MSLYNFDSITKKGALSYAQGLASRLMVQPTDEEIALMLWKPYDHSIFDPNEIMKRLEML